MTSAAQAPAICVMKMHEVTAMETMQPHTPAASHHGFRSESVNKSGNWGGGTLEPQPAARFAKADVHRIAPCMLTLVMRRYMRCVPCLLQGGEKAMQMRHAAELTKPQQVVPGWSSMALTPLM